MQGTARHLRKPQSIISRVCFFVKITYSFEKVLRSKPTERAASVTSTMMKFALFQSSVRPFDAAQPRRGASVSGKSDAEQELQQRELRGAQQRRPESRATSRSVPHWSSTTGWGKITFAVFDGNVYSAVLIPFLIQGGNLNI